VRRVELRARIADERAPVRRGAFHVSPRGANGRPRRYSSVRSSTATIPRARPPRSPCCTSSSGLPSTARALRRRRTRSHGRCRRPCRCGR
jgi:hypothetical protein